MWNFELSYFDQDSGITLVRVVTIDNDMIAALAEHDFQVLGINTTGMSRFVSLV